VVYQYPNNNKHDDRLTKQTLTAINNWSKHRSDLQMANTRKPNPTRKAIVHISEATNTDKSSEHKK
jgi:hypothetical protein